MPRKTAAIVNGRSGLRKKRSPDNWMAAARPGTRPKAVKRSQRDAGKVTTEGLLESFSLHGRNRRRGGSACRGAALAPLLLAHTPRSASLGRDGARAVPHGAGGGAPRTLSAPGLLGSRC